MSERPLPQQSDRLRWRSSHLLAWCPVCPDQAHCREENPTASSRARVVRWAHRHAKTTGHAVHFEDGRIAILDAPAMTGERP